MASQAKAIRYGYLTLRCEFITLRGCVVCRKYVTLPVATLLPQKPQVQTSQAHTPTQLTSPSGEQSCTTGATVLTPHPLQVHTRTPRLLAPYHIVNCYMQFFIFQSEESCSAGAWSALGWGARLIRQTRC